MGNESIQEAIVGKINEEMTLFRDQLHRYFKTEEFERRVLKIVFGYKVDMAEKINVDYEPPRSGQPWTDAEVAQLEREVGKLMSKLAGMYGRTPKAIEAKARALGLLGYKN